MRSYVHWLKINGSVISRDESRQYREIQSYLDRYPDSVATIYLYEANLFDRVVKLECNQNWNDLDLDANTGSHRLRRLTRQPNNLINPQPFKTPEWLHKAHHDGNRDHGAR